MSAMSTAVILQAAGVLMMLLSVSASSFAVWRADLAREKLASLRGDRDDLTARVTRLESEKDLAEARAVAAERRLVVVESLADPTSRLEHLQVTLDSHDQRVETLTAQISAQHTDTCNALADIKALAGGHRGTDRRSR